MDINLEQLKQELWNATDYGRQFFEDEFASEIARNRGRLKGFAVRTEDKTGSCHINQKTSDKGPAPYTFTDFGVENKGMNAIDYVVKRDHCTFWEALKKLCSQYGVPLPEGNKVTPTVEFSSNVEEDEGFWKVSFSSSYKNKKLLQRLFPFYTEELLKEYVFKEIESYQTVGVNEKGNKYKKTTIANADFPIFGYDKGDYVKIYQPYAPKGDAFIHKHSFVGDKSGKRIIYGWDRLFEKVEYETIQQVIKDLKTARNSETKKDLLAQLDKLKLETVIIATGGTDGINIASLGYDVIWFNSETEVINSQEYYELSQIAKNIYYIPDLDETGVKQAVQIADSFLDIKLVWLPKDLKYSKKKDFADWLRREKNAGKEILQAIFAKMLNQALNFRFWTFSDKGTVQFNPTKIIHFLHLKGFYTFASNYSEQKEDECEFVSLKQGKLEKILSTNIKKYVLEWIDNKVYNEQVRNRVFSAAAFQPSHLKMLPMFDKDITNYGRSYQWYFFANEAIKIQKDSIASYKYSGALKVQFWKDEIINHNISLLTPFFEKYTDEQGRTRIKILNKDSNYFKVLINSSRIYWEKDANEAHKDLNPFGIASENLTEAENYEQELHLMNKIYCVGYMLHQHKRESESFIVIGTDYKGGNSVKGSYGGTGKSFLVNGIRKMLNSKYIDGKTLGNNKFPYDKVTEKTRLVFLDDMNFNQDFRDFYNKVTGDFEANHKGGKIYYIPFERSPKMAATTNYVPDFEESSLVRRLLFYQNGDYYHAKTPKNDYLFSRKISDDFGGRDIMNSDYSAEEWNADYNFLFNCLQFYLSSDQPIMAPLEALQNRRALLSIGDNCLNFFNDYFTDEAKLNHWINKPEFVREAISELGNKYTPYQVYKKLQEYCNIHKWELQKAKRKTENGNSLEHFYIDTKQLGDIPAIEEPTQPSSPPAPHITDNLSQEIDF